MHKMIKNIARIAGTPRRHLVVEPANVSNAIVANMTRTPSLQVVLLIARPCTLHNLWAECQLGGSGRNFATEFYAGKCGAVKQNYSFFKLLWDKIAEMVHASNMVHVACDKIYADYGKSLTVKKLRGRCRWTVALASGRRS